MPASVHGRWAAFLLLAVSAAACATVQSDGQAVPAVSVAMPPSYRFEPAAIRVQAGEAVTWTNSDHFSHNVHILGTGGWHSEVLAPGESAVYTFADPGEYVYQCDLHPQDMTGTVIVTRP